jgi:hypothetical protein
VKSIRCGIATTGWMTRCLSSLDSSWRAVMAWRWGDYRALVAHRANLAAERGRRYIEVDASDDSRPILERLGFVAVKRRRHASGRRRPFQSLGLVYPPDLGERPAR